MNPESLLALIGDLYAQLRAATDEVNRLRAAAAESAAKTEPDFT